MKKWIYRHFKWKLYELVWVWKDAETLEDYIIYRALYVSEDFPNLEFWVRKKDDFLWKVNINNKSVARFEYIWSKKYENI